MEIIHAVGNENGTAYGGRPGDQTGKEIRKQKWYDRPWTMYLEPPSRTLGKLAAQWAERICNGNFGYDRTNRWSGYNSIVKNGKSVVGAVGDFDCSSLCVSCYIFAGLKGLKTTGYTATLKKIFTALGFKCYEDEAHLKSTKYAVAGGLYLTPNAHVAMCVEDGECATDIYEEEEDDSVEKVKVVYGSVYTRKYPVSGGTLTVQHKGDKLKLLGTDSQSGWYKVETIKGEGFITNNERYVVKV